MTSAAAARLHSVSWNLTRRCNLGCAHCYIGAGPGADRRQELSTAECLGVMDGIARAYPGVFLILTGGEPLLRRDLPALAAAAGGRGFTVVVGTNGWLLGERRARALKERGVAGVSLSLDSTDPARHDAFRGLAGAWRAAIRAARAAREAGLDFSLHMTVTGWNAGEIPSMMGLAESLGARALNCFFLVRTGCGETLSDLSPERCEAALADLARRQAARPAGGLMVQAKCAPQFRRILWQQDPGSPLLRNYAHGACPAGINYCRITPEGDVTPCPFMPVVAGSLRERAFADLWGSAPVLQDLRARRLRGRCGACEFRLICGGCRCRAYAASGDYLGEDPACAYEPGGCGDRLVELPAAQTFGLEAVPALPWEEAATARLEAVPSFARAMVVRAVEAYARARGAAVVTPAVMAEARARWGAGSRPAPGPAGSPA